MDEAEPAPIKTYSLEEVAAMVLPPDMSNAVRWLGAQIRSGRASAYKAGRSWRMTHQDVEDLIARNRNKVRPVPKPDPEPEPEQYPRGLSRRSRLYRERYGWEGNPNLQGPRKNRPVVEAAKTLPVRERVYPESVEAIAKMGPLSDSQQALLDRVRREGEVVITGVGVNRTVESLVRRDLVTYEVIYELNEKWSSYRKKFTIKPKP